MKDALYEIESMRPFAGIELNEDAIPDETTSLQFRRLLETHSLAPKLLAGSQDNCVPKTKNEPQTRCKGGWKQEIYGAGR